ncbi:ATPase domain-containing protein [Salinirarus marinus]|uniref:ATPase domain-containing protein n=1 Tax=Salinirarus marinus TaxID=3068310 RepID=UPI003C6CA5A0
MDDPPNASEDERGERLSTGIEGFDDVLYGGFVPNRAYLVRGEPGTGKTLLGTHFLTAGDPNESLFINLGQPESDVRSDAAALGFDLSSVEFLDLSPESEFFAEGRTYDVFPPGDVETGAFVEPIADAVTDLQPTRVFVDPVTQFRYLSPDEYQFRKQILSFLQFVKSNGGTVLFTSQATTASPDDDLQFMSDGIVHLRYGTRKRSVEVTKHRGSDFRSGTHAMKVGDDGMTVFPELVPGRHRAEFSPEAVSSGVPGVDALLNGGLERGTVTIVSGPSGVGKTTFGGQFMKEAAGRGERSVIFLFEESRGTFVHRSESINVPVREMMDRGTLKIEEVEPLEHSPESFAGMVRTEVEDRDASVVMVDGLKGYQLSMTGEGEAEFLTEIHALGRYLRNMGVTAIFTSETASVTGAFSPTEHGVSYLADNIVFLRYLELGGELRKAIGVLKKRGSDFERTLREFEITEYGIEVGAPLSNLRGILSGTPEWAGPRGEERTE